MKMQAFILSAVLLVGATVFVVGFLGGRSSGGNTARARVGNREYVLEVAQTPLDQARGLSGRESLAVGSGMLFVFDRPGDHRFWMMGMRFPLDFIWVNGGTVVGITENVPPPCEGETIIEKCAQSLTSFTSQERFDKVIELNAGEAARSGVSVGDVIEIQNVENRM